MPRLVEVKPLPGYRLWLRFDDGVEGVVDLSGLVGKGVFVIWKDEERFRSVRIGDGGELVWEQDVDLCPDALYLEITGKRPAEVFPNLKAVQEIHA